MSIAQRLGYISVVEILRPVTDATVALDTMDEKYKVIVPEIMQEAPMSDSEDEGSEWQMYSVLRIHWMMSWDLITVIIIVVIIIIIVIVVVVVVVVAIVTAHLWCPAQWHTANITIVHISQYLFTMAPKPTTLVQAQTELSGSKSVLSLANKMNFRHFHQLKISSFLINTE